MSVYQEVSQGCALLNGLAPSWDGDGRQEFTDTLVVEVGVTRPTPIFLVRSDCASAMALGHDVPAEYGIEPEGFVRVRMAVAPESGEVVLAASVDFRAEGTSDLQMIRIDDLSLSRQEGFHARCVF